MDHTFPATRGWRRGWFFVGLAVFLVCVGGTALLAASLGERASAYASFAMFFGVAAWMAAMFLAARPLPGTLALEAGALVASWRKRPLPVHEVALGRWVQAGMDTTIGLVAHVRGDGAALRIGGRSCDDEGYHLSADPARSVECMLAPEDFARLVLALGVRHEDVRSSASSIPLVKNRLSFRGALGGMWPWLLTIAACGIYGAVIGETGLAEQLAGEPGGQWLLGGIPMAIVALGITITIVRASRIKRPQLTLVADAMTLGLYRKGDHQLAVAPWSAVRGERQRYRMRHKGGVTILPAIELLIGDHPPLRLALWDPSSAWTDEVPRGRTPRYLIGAPEWRRLVGLLRQHHRLS